MKRTTLTLVMVFMVLSCMAQHNWAIAFLRKGAINPAIVEYHSIVEMAGNGIKYHRIFDDGFRFRKESYNPIKLQYGYRLADKQIYIYDFDSQKESLAFDFNLSIGDQFTTFNGIEWVVDEVKDTLVNISFCGKGECVLKRLLAVRTLDGTMTDQWLEDFGSFYNHFMIKSLDGIKYSQTLWMEYEMGEYLAREINTDPLFCHDSGWMDGTDNGDISDVPDTRCTYENGLLKFENVQWWWDHRDYTCFYRKGDDIYKLYSWEFEPHVESGASSLQKDVIIFENLPTPSSCQYTLHIDNDEYPTSIRNVTMHPVTSKGIYDMQGRQQTKHPVQGVYVEARKEEVRHKIIDMSRIILTVLSFIGIRNLCAQPLFINEVQVANIDQFIDPSYNYGGWIELYNPGTEHVSLNGYTIRHTDSEGDIEQCTLKAANGSVPAKGYAVIWFDHNSADGAYGGNAGTQIPFKLDADGGVIEVLDASNSIVNAIEYPACIARCSWMREMDGASRFGWTNEPSPKSTNNNSHIAEERLKAPIINSTGGVFSGSYSFTVSIPEGCTLYYTVDGSAPMVNSSLVSSNGVFHGNENTIYRFMLTCKGCLNSPVVTRSFFKSDGNYTLPVLSVNTGPKNFFDNTIGLYVTGTNGRVANNSKVKANQNMDWERPVNVEYFVPDVNQNYKEALNQEANFSIFGGWTRFNPGNEDFEYRSSFKLKSGKEFEGANSFAYPVFGSKPYIKIKNFLVRNGGQDKYCRIWDAAIHELLRTSGVYLDCQAWQPAHVYLNGKYLGTMNLREESNKQFAFSNYGIDKDEIDQWEGDIIIKEGDQVKLNEWYNLSKKLTGASSDTVTWKQIADLVDIDEYCNYMAAEIYMGNLDWLRGGFKNLKGFRAKDDGGKFHLVLHDVDGGFGDTDMILQVLNKGTGSLPVRFKNMLKYEPFKKQFIDAYCIMNGSVFDPERCLPIVNTMRNMLNPALALEEFSADERADRLITRLSDDEERRPALKQSLMTAFNLKDEYTVNLKSNTTEARLLLNG